MLNINCQNRQILTGQTRWGVPMNRGAAMASKKQQIFNNNSEDDQFEPDYHTMKKLKFPINRKRLTKGNWTLHENKIYLTFLIHNRHSFVDETTRRQQRVFCKLSQLLNKKRTPDQCRSHHQKLLANLNNSIDDLIAKIERKIKIRESHISALNIEEEKPISTGIPEVELAGKHEIRKAQHRQIEKTMERGFYRINIYKGSNSIKVQINSEHIANY